MSQLIHSIVEKLVSKLPADATYITPQELIALGLPDFFIERVRIELEKNLAESVMLPDSDWADMHADQVQDAWFQFLSAIRAETRIPTAYARSIFETAVEDILEILIEPRTNLPNYLFGTTEVLSFDVISLRTRWVVVYKYLGSSLVRYMQKKNLDEISRDQAAKVIAAVDEKLTAGYNPLNWAQMLQPWFELMDKPDADLLSRFFADKNMDYYARQFAKHNGTLDKPAIIEFMSLPFQDDEHPKEDTEQEEPEASDPYNDIPVHIRPFITQPEPDSAYMPPDTIEEESSHSTVSDDDTVDTAEHTGDTEEDVEDLDASDDDDVLTEDEEQDESELEAADEEDQPESTDDETDEVTTDEDVTDEDDPFRDDPVESEEDEIVDAADEEDHPESTDDETDEVTTDEDETDEDDLSGDESEESEEDEAVEAADEEAQPDSTDEEMDDDTTDEEVTDEDDPFRDDPVESEEDEAVEAADEEAQPDSTDDEMDDDTTDEEVTDEDDPFGDDSEESEEDDSEEQLQESEENEYEPTADEPIQKEEPVSESEELKEIPMWRRYIPEEPIEDEPDTQEQTVSGYDPAAYKNADEEDEKPLIDMIQNDATEEEEETGLLHYLQDRQNDLVNSLFGGDENAFLSAIEDIEEKKDWSAAGKYISNEIFRRNMIDLYSDEAIDFTDRIQTYFIEKSKR